MRNLSYAFVAVAFAALAASPAMAQSAKTSGFAVSPTNLSAAAGGVAVERVRDGRTADSVLE